ncbi:MAG TPA: TetR/AcrR family transcriptional regulator [Acidimicrobiales bacterium]|nr:TetR/AcrR family transcriptional regulator [Acidimicrobiales bacterium]
MATAPARRRSAELTRRKLLDAGRAAFATLGHDGVNLQRDILTPAGVSVGSFYHQFHDKTDLLVAVVDEGGQLGRAMVAGQGDEPADPVAATRAAFARWFATVDGGEDLVRIHLRERYSPNPRVRAVLTRSHAAWIDAWAESFQRFAGPGSSFDPRQAARVVVAIGLGLLLTYLDAPPEDRPALRRELIDAAVPFTVGGFVALGAADPAPD